MLSHLHDQGSVTTNECNRHHPCRRGRGGANMEVGVAQTGEVLCECVVHGDSVNMTHTV